MSSPEYRKALGAACREWERVAAARAALDRRLADLQRSIATLTRLCGLQPTVPFGLADACRLALMRHHGRALTAQAVRDELGLMGLDLTSHANPLASVHVTLKRLAAAGQARFIPGGEKRPPMYAWAGPIRPVVARSRKRAASLWPPLFFTSPVPDPAGRKGKRR
jgi:hypothetical protein